MDSLLCLFHNTRDVIKTEKILKKNNFIYKIMPLPRSLSATCGLSIEITGVKKEDLEEKIGLWQMPVKEVRNK